MADCKRLYEAGAPRDHRWIERWTFDGRRHHATARALPRGSCRRAAAGHVAISELPDGEVLGSGVRIGGGCGAVQIPARLLPVSSRAAWYEISGGAPHSGR